MITDNDVKKLKTVFSTKQDLSSGLESIRGELSSFRNEVLDRLDKIIGHQKKESEEKVFHQSEHDRLEKRLSRIETP